MNPSEKQWETAHDAMIAKLEAYKVTDMRVLAAMRKMRRHVYIPEELRQDNAYGDHPCPIGYKQTISQPYIVAYMTQVMKIRDGEKVLEIGTGSGYQAAILAELGADVYSVEIIPELAQHARRVLDQEGYREIQIFCGDGYRGWPEHAPFDVIIVACAPEEIPAALKDQLDKDGRMIIPVGPGPQRLVILHKKGRRILKTNDMSVRFVPMVHGKDRDPGSSKEICM